MPLASGKEVLNNSPSPSFAVKRQLDRRLRTYSIVGRQLAHLPGLPGAGGRSMRRADNPWVQWLRIPFRCLNLDATAGAPCALIASPLSSMRHPIFDT